MNPVGESIVTAQGIYALLEANTRGERVKVKSFVFSEDDVDLDPNRDSLSGWLQKDISLYTILDEHTVEFVCDVAPEEATHYTKTAGLLLEDGTLFMLAKPPFPFPPMLRQTFKIQLRYQNAQELLDFGYLPFYETEQELSILEVAAALGGEVLDLSEQSGNFAMAMADYYAFKEEMYGRVGRVEQESIQNKAQIESLSLALLENSAQQGSQILANAQEIGLIKTHLQLKE